MAGFSDAFFMQKALEQANLAYEKDEVPVGALLVKNNEVLSSAHNLSITKNDPTAHAEILCLKEAGKVLNNYRLIGTTLYVTLEPCMMCAGAIIHARISRLVYATSDENHKLDISSGILDRECSKLIKSFFKEKRSKY
jgi:tRNA(adenine34) deaminase